MSSLLLQSSSVEPGSFGVTLVLGSATGRTENPYDRLKMFSGATVPQSKYRQQPMLVERGTAGQ